MKRLLLLLLFLTIHLQAEQSNLAFGHEQIISTGLSGSDIQTFSLAMSQGTDTGVAVWENINGGNTEIWYSFFDSTAGGWQGPIQQDSFINNSGRVAAPVAALNDNGDGFLIYAKNPGEPNTIVIQQISSITQLPGTQTTFTSSDFLYLPNIGLNNNGQAVASWLDLASATNVIAVATTAPFTFSDSPTTLSSSDFNPSDLFARPQTKVFVLNGTDQGLVIFEDLSHPVFAVSQSIVTFPNMFSNITLLSDLISDSGSVSLDSNINGVSSIGFGDTVGAVARYSKDGGNNWGPFAFFPGFCEDVSVSLRGDAGFSIISENEQVFAAYTTNGLRYFLSQQLSATGVLGAIGINRSIIPTALDAFGNQIVLWADATTLDLNYSFRIHRGNYSRPFTVFSPPIQGLNPQVKATYDGLYVAAYQRLSDRNLASTWTVLLSPRDLRIESSTENRFPTLSNREVVLTWTGGIALIAPQTPGNVITDYLIFRNGRLIGEVPANADPAFIYRFVDCAATDHAEYSVASFGPYGMSAPLGINLSPI